MSKRKSHPRTNRLFEAAYEQVACRANWGADSSIESTHELALGANAVFAASHAEGLAVGSVPRHVQASIHAAAQSMVERTLTNQGYVIV